MPARGMILLKGSLPEFHARSSPIPNSEADIFRLTQKHENQAPMTSFQDKISRAAPGTKLRNIFNFGAPVLPPQRCLRLDDSVAV